MRDLNQIQVPPRFGVYVVLGGIAVWIIRSNLLTLTYAIAIVTLVFYMLWKPSKSSGA